MAVKLASLKEDFWELRSGEKCHAEIPFRAEHVIDIDSPPEDYIKWQLGQEPERKWYRR